MAKSPEPLAAHVIRLGITHDITAALRAQTIRTFNRFKQIKAPRLMIVGRDVASGNNEFEYAQISTFTTEAEYREYFYDPIHLAADREAETLHAINRGQSFDIYPHWTDDLTARLKAMNSERTARYQANDDRPATPPVMDRPRDQRWAFGKTFFYVGHFSLPKDAPSSDERVRAFNALREQVLTQTVAAGRATRSVPLGQRSYALILRLGDELSYDRLTSTDGWRRAHTTGLFAPEIHSAFFVMDPDDEVLASRMAQGLDRP
jgi:hypothetical protein